MYLYVYVHMCVRNVGISEIYLAAFFPWANDILASFFSWVNNFLASLFPGPKNRPIFFRASLASNPKMALFSWAYREFGFFFSGVKKYLAIFFSCPKKFLAIFFSWGKKFFVGLRPRKILLCQYVQMFV